MDEVTVTDYFKNVFYLQQTKPILSHGATFSDGIQTQDLEMTRLVLYHYATSACQQRLDIF